MTRTTWKTAKTRVAVADGPRRSREGSLVSIRARPLGNEQHLADAALLREPLRLCGLGEREGLLDRDLQLAPRRRLGELAESLRVRMGEERLDAQIASLGAGRLAHHAPDRTALADPGDDLLDGLAAHRVGDGVQLRQARDLLVVVECHHLIDEELLRFRLLLCADPGD